MKKVFVLLLAAIVMTLVGCTNEDKTTRVLLNNINLVDNNGDIIVDLETSGLQEKYDSLKRELEGVDLDRVAFTTTTTANIFYELGYLPVAAPLSSQLNPELTELQCEASKKDGGGHFDYNGCVAGDGKIANIGSALAPDLETIIAINPSAVFLSDAFTRTADQMTQLQEAGIQVVYLPQSHVEDIFVILQVLKDIETNEERLAIIDSTLTEIKTEVDYSYSFLPETNEDVPTVAIISASRGGQYVQGTQTVIGDLVFALGLENVYGDQASTELNLETLLMHDPEYIILFGHGQNIQEAVDAFEAQLIDDNSQYRSLQAVQNQNYVVLSPTIGSVDFTVSDTLIEIAEGIYGTHDNIE